MKKMKINVKVWQILFVIGVIILLTITICNNKATHKELNIVLNELVKSKQDKNKMDINEFINHFDEQKKLEIPENDTIVYEFIKDIGAWYPDIIMAQYIRESGHGKSGLSQDYNNCYGMKYIGTNGRYNLQIPNIKVMGGYGTYLNWQHSTYDRILLDYHKFKGIKPTRENYIKRFSDYAEDSQYWEKINKESQMWNF